MFEKVEEWLNEGPKQKIIGFLILLYSIYTFLWGLAEPMQIDVSCCLGLWRTSFIGASFVISGIIFIAIVPLKIIQRFGFETNDTSLESSNKIAYGSPVISKELNSYYGNVFHVNGKFEDASDFQIKTQAQNATKLSYTFHPLDYFLFYLKVKLVSQSGSGESIAWIAIKYNQYSIQTVTANKEMIFPVNFRHGKGDFITIHINIRKAVKNTFGQSGWKYGHIEGFRIRGTVDIASIVPQ